MYESVEMFKTKDGRLYETKKHARRHVETIICDTFLNVLSGARNLTQADKISIAAILYENREKIRAALDFETFGEG